MSDFIHTLVTFYTEVGTVVTCRVIHKIFIRLIYLKDGEEYMEIDFGTLFSIILGTFLVGMTIGELIERGRNKQTYENTYNPLITDFRKQKKEMWKKISERIK